MRWGRLRVWRSRLLAGVLVGVGGFVLAVVLRFDPHPVAYVVMMTIVLTLLWLVVDTVDAPPAQWAAPAAAHAPTGSTSPPPTCASCPATRRPASPSSAVRDRLVSLARARDPDLAVALHRELDPVLRLSPTEIDRILTRIEESRDRT